MWNASSCGRSLSNDSARVPFILLRKALSKWRNVHLVSVQQKECQIQWQRSWLIRDIFQMVTVCAEKMSLLRF
jgi:hypothetical protein